MSDEFTIDGYTGKDVLCFLAGMMLLVLSMNLPQPDEINQLSHSYEKEHSHEDFIFTTNTGDRCMQQHPCTIPELRRITGERLQRRHLVLPVQSESTTNLYCSY
ncbi:hypothetical protein TDB9533_01256 [Thalassocella blandensis]|nr:hypothetical protein TDB9533_01256 [Thalassocella blandensis]